MRTATVRMRNISAGDTVLIGQRSHEYPRHLVLAVWVSPSTGQVQVAVQQVVTGYEYTVAYDAEAAIERMIP